MCEVVPEDALPQHGVERMMRVNRLEVVHQRVVVVPVGDVTEIAGSRRGEPERREQSDAEPGEQVGEKRRARSRSSLHAGQSTTTLSIGRKPK
jgi:hypothetical protein